MLEGWCKILLEVTNSAEMYGNLLRLQNIVVETTGSTSKITTYFRKLDLRSLKMIIGGGRRYKSGQSPRFYRAILTINAKCLSSYCIINILLWEYIRILKAGKISFQFRKMMGDQIH